MNYPTEVLADSPTLYWRLNETTPGTGSAADSSTGGHAGTYVASPTSVVGLQGATSDKAVLFNGTTQWVTSTYAPFTGSSSLTFEGWANWTSGTGTLFGGDTANPPEFRQSSGTGFNWYPDRVNSTAVTWGGVTGTNSVPYHWVLTYNDSTRVSELFINGVSQGQLTSNVGYNASPGNFKVGARSTSSEPWTGVIDDVAVYTGILSSARILLHYQRGAIPGITNNNYQFIKVGNGMSVSERIR